MLLTSIFSLYAVCSPNATGYECRCQEHFAWPNDLCVSHGACSAIIGGTCGCINGRPPNGKHCQRNNSQPGRFSTPTGHTNGHLWTNRVHLCKCTEYDNGGRYSNYSNPVEDFGSALVFTVWGKSCTCFSSCWSNLIICIWGVHKYQSYRPAKNYFNEIKVHSLSSVKPGIPITCNHL